MKKPLIEPLQNGMFELAKKRLDSLTKPAGSLGRLEEFAWRLVAITNQETPFLLSKKAIFIFAGDHGVTEEGISLYPREVTEQMVYNFIRGGAGINVLAKHASAEVIVVDIGVDCDFGKQPNLIIEKVVRGTGNMKKGPAMTREEAEKCIDAGITIAIKFADRGYNMFGTGDMGIGNTTPSSAIAAVITGKNVSQVTDRGTGLSDRVLEHKIKVIEDSIALNKPDPYDPIDVLSKVGGAEIGGIAGLILGGASRRIPVVIDGFISAAGALIAFAIDPAVADYIFAAHSSMEKGHNIILERMDLKPILNLEMRLGEGTGAALAMHIIEGGLKIYRDMSTFDEAGISREMT